MLGVEADPGEDGGALISEGGLLVRAPPRCGRVSTPIHSPAPWLNLPGRPNSHVSPLPQKGDSLGEQQRSGPNRAKRSEERA